MARATSVRPAPISPGKSEDFTFAHDEIDILDHTSPIKVLYFENDFVIGGWSAWTITLEEGAPHHHADDRIHTGGRGRHRIDVLDRHA